MESLAAVLTLPAAALPATFADMASCHWQLQMTQQLELLTAVSQELCRQPFVLHQHFAAAGTHYTGCPAGL
jgi:hypothetical protein